MTRRRLPGRITHVMDNRGLSDTFRGTFDLDVGDRVRATVEVEIRPGKRVMLLVQLHGCGSASFNSREVYRSRATQHVSDWLEERRLA